MNLHPRLLNMPPTKLWKVEHEIHAETVHDAANIWLEKQIKAGDAQVGYRYYLRITMLELAHGEEGHRPIAQFLSVCAEPVYRIESVMGFHGWPKPPDRERSTLILERTPFLK